MKAICVYLGANIGNNFLLTEAAVELGQLIAEAGIRLIYGGSSLGLMGKLSESVLSHGGQVTGIIPRSLLVKEKPSDQLDELIITETIQARKLLFQQRADAFLVFPGGLGTLEEAFETWNAVAIGTLKTPMGFLNIDGYYDKLLAFLLDCKTSGFIGEPQFDIPIVKKQVHDLFFDLKRYI
ncbi:MAG: TIGR00730 family Rossman fold protein [Gammaproteobacteria bacterium]|nr:TIGR00730 family Rossman fold protein [Gammaproteobacteria bacterium]MCH9763304.1 TIGR00730 family Rossman fold protein [Gammaproteobacteria bacterium]